MTLPVLLAHRLHFLGHGLRRRAEHCPSLAYGRTYKQGNPESDANKGGRIIEVPKSK